MSRGGSVGSIRTNSTVSMASAPRDSNIPALQPSYASSQFVLQAQGSSILCLQHDSLAAERRFVRHKEDVTIISVDNISDVIATRVVSVDKSKTAIVWDIDSGDVLSQYEAYEDILVATWMKNGNLVFGIITSSVIRSSSRSLFLTLSQAIPWATSYSSIRKTQMRLRRGRFSTLCVRLLQLPTAGRSLWGMRTCQSLRGRLLTLHVVDTTMAQFSLQHYRQRLRYCIR